MAEFEKPRMTSPPIDTRDVDQLYAMALALAPQYAAAWKHLSAQDAGLTLLRAFAMFGEGMLSRINRMPENHFVALLNTLGIKRNPPDPAQAYVTFTPLPNQTQSLVVPKGLRIQTANSETQRAEVFETDSDTFVQPAALTRMVLFANLLALDYSAALVAPQTPVVVTGAWGQGNTVYFGFDRPIVGEFQLGFPLHLPARAKALDGSSVFNIQWAYSGANNTWPDITASVVDGTAKFRQSGTIRFNIPKGAWASVHPVGTPGPAYWLVLGTSYGLAQDEGLITFTWSSVLLNFAAVTQALTIPTPELLGTSDGTALQLFSLKNFPVYRKPDSDAPYQHLQLGLGPDLGSLESWTRVDDFPPGPGKYFRLDPAAGEIRFGDFSPASGMGSGSIPDKGARVYAVSYRYVATESDDRVAGGMLTVLNDKTLKGLVRVTNPEPARYGANEQPIENTLQRAPRLIRARNRAATVEDYESLAYQCSSRVAIARALPPRLNAADRGPLQGQFATHPRGTPWLYGGIDRSPGNLTVIVVPRDTTVARPRPTDELLGDVHRYLDARRDAAVNLSVVGPRYVPIKVTATAILFEKAAATMTELQLKQQITDAIIAFLHPVSGGPGGAGWSVGQSVAASDLYPAIAPPSDVGFITELTLTHTDPPEYGVVPWHQGKQRPFDLVSTAFVAPLADYELVCADPNPSVVVNPV